MTRRLWTQYEIDLVEAFYPDISTDELAAMLDRTESMVFNRAHAMGLKKSYEFLSSAASGRLMRDDHRGREFQFKKGFTPWNKGMKGLEIGGKETRFKKGSLNGRAMQIYKPIGSERISKDGYLQRKINDDMPPQKRWRAVHILLWESINGPLPNGYAVVFKDGNKENIVIENLEMISRADLMRRNTYHNYPKEVAQLVQLRGALSRQINKRERKAQ